MDGWHSLLTVSFIMSMLWSSELLCGVHAGINAVLFYTPVIFTALGASQQAALLSAVAVRPAGLQTHALPGHQCAQYCCGCKASRADVRGRELQQDKMWPGGAPPRPICGISKATCRDQRDPDTSARGRDVQVGGTMVVGTIVSLLLVDRVGRRPLLIEGGVQVPSP